MALDREIPRIGPTSSKSNVIWMKTNGVYEVATTVGRAPLINVRFQSGPLDGGHNGVLPSDLLEVLIHKLSADGNQQACKHLYAALLQTTE